MDIYEIYFVVAGLAVVQSLFGFGMLIFGTPTLLLLGYPFADTSAALFPPAIAISLLQNIMGRRISRQTAIMIAKWCLIPLAPTFILMLSLSSLDIKSILLLPIAMVLSFFAVLRMSPALTQKIEHYIVRHRHLWLLCTGIVHGFSNLGMGLAALLASAQHKEKEDVRAFVAFCQTTFVSLQLVILGTSRPELFGWRQLFCALLAGAIFLLAGQHMFNRLSTSIFNKVFTAIIASYALLLFAQYFGAF